MTKSKCMSAMALAILLTTAASCDDWGRKDPPAGNQVKPTLENVAVFDFETEEGLLDPAVFKAVANPGGAAPEIVEDEIKGNVLHLDNGYLSISNPFNKVTLQEAASFTFWMKQPVLTETDDEGNETALPQNLAGPLFSFENETRNARLSINPNGGFTYEAPDGEWKENDPAEFTTGYITPGEWHYVAVIINNDGYDWWVDGDRKVSKTLAGFDCSKLVKFINNVPVMTIGSPDNNGLWLADDIKVYRNTITAKETARPNIGNGGSGPGGFDFSKFEYVIGTPIFNVGQPDCSSPWWTDFSNYYRIPAETSMNFRFINHTAGTGNWTNWNLCVATDADRGADGYAEYFVIRSDLFGWGESYNGDNWSSTGYGDWDKFRVDMEGAVVNVNVVRTGSRIDVKAVANCPDGTVYEENFFAECGDGSNVVRAFFIVDSSYLEFDKDNCYPYWPVEINTPNIGQPDCSSPWWTDFSDYYTIPSGMSLRLNFINHTAGTGNWTNWNLCVATDADRGADGYAEYFVIRSDLFGWGEAYNGDNWSNTGYGDWDKFRVDMEGANVTLLITRNGAEVKVDATAECADGTVYVEHFTAQCGDGSQILRAFLIVDSSYLNMNAAGSCLFTPTYK